MQDKNSITKTIEQHNFKVKKHFGQNFLSDFFITSKIAELSKIDKDTVVIEIGPGTGALTEELLKKSKKVIAYEIDSEVIPILKENLKQYNNLEVIESDILKADLSYITSQSEKMISVANLPYYITSPIISLFLKKLTNVKKGVFMVQKEVADRICAKVSTKDYNAFSIEVQYACETNKILNVPRTCFVPAPNVDSSVIELNKIERKNKAINDEFFFKVVEASFKERRKTLVNNLSGSFDLSKERIKEILSELEIKEDARAETLTIDEFIELTNTLYKTNE